MSRIETILNSSLFIDAKSRDRLLLFGNLKLDIYSKNKLKENKLLNKDIFSILFNDKNNAIDILPTYPLIIESSTLSDLNQFKSDKVLQRLVFFCLIYSFNKFPDNDSWKIFLDGTYDYKYEKIKNEIISISTEIYKLEILNKLTATRIEIEINKNNIIKRKINMSRINQIVESSLFKNPRTRSIFKKIIEIKINRTYPDFNFNNEELSKIIYDDYNNVSEIIHLTILDSFQWSGIGLSLTDSVLHRLIFFSLIYSYDQFPDNESWALFLQNTEEHKIERVRDGILNVSLELYKQDITTKLTEQI
jgi:hypothetical protein